MAWSQLSQIKVSEIHPGLHSWPVKAKTIQMWTTQDKKDNTRVPYLQLILFDSKINLISLLNLIQDEFGVMALSYFHAETSVIFCTFCQLEVSEPIDTQRLTSSFAPLSSRGGEFDDMRGYLMVTRTFRQPGASEPVDAQRLTLFPVPFVTQGQRVRW
ncbi:hypothetical protein JHK86_019096 [Glycine max]|nr:hypothetical protein JHK86_019096 [Glycine max]